MDKNRKAVEALGTVLMYGHDTAKVRNPVATYLETRTQMPMSWEEIAHFLYARLDDIDTASDIAKGHHAIYRALVDCAHKRRFEVATTDGYTVEFHVSKRQPEVAAVALKPYEERIARLEAALEWYEEQGKLAQLIHTEGNAGRQALAVDGGELARRTLRTGDDLREILAAEEQKE